MRTDAGGLASGQGDEKKQVLGLVAGEPPVVDPARHVQNPERGGVDETDVMFREHSRRLVNLAAAITLDRWLAEEVVQDAFAGLHATRRRSMTRSATCSVPW